MASRSKLSVIFMLLIIGIVMMASCAPAQPAPAPAAPQEAAPAAEEPVNVVFWSTWGGTREPLLREVLDMFEAENPGITVELATLDGKTDTQKMLTAVAGGAPPDLYMTHTNDVSMWAALDAFKPINEYVEADGLNLLDHFYPGSISGSTFDGDIIQLPFKVPSTMMIWFNKELFEEAGLDPENPPTTWQELEDAAAKLTKMNGDVIELAPLNVCINCLAGPEQPYNEWLSRNGASYLTPDGKGVAFNGERGIETIQWMKDFMDNTVGGFGNFSAQFGTDFIENRPAFYAGQLAMTIDGPWFWDILRTEAPEMADKVGVFLIPYNGDNPDAESRYIPYGVPGYAIPAEAANPDGAWEVLKWITMDGGCKFFQMQNRADSPLVDCVDPEVRESNPHFDTFVAALNTVQVAPSPSVFSQIHVRMKEMEESVLLDNETAEEGIAAAAADVEALLAEAK